MTEHGVTITWLGHAATKIDTPDGKLILIDPWIHTNPKTPEANKHLGRVDLMLISHGHDDNMHDSIAIAKDKQPRIIAMNELCKYLTSKGVQHCSGGNTGGTQEWDGHRITMVDAIHSSSVEEDGHLIYTGLAVGFVIRFNNGFTVYHAGDTDVFEGMKLIGRLYKPDVALLPIGSHYTMGPQEAAEATRLLGVKTVIPIHYGTFPLLTGTPQEFEKEAGDISGLHIIMLSPGESVSQAEIMRSQESKSTVGSR